MTERDLNVMEEDLHVIQGGLTIAQRVAALLGRAMGHPIRSLYKDRLEPALPLWCPLLPRSNPGDVSVLPTDERRGVFRTQAGRANVPALRGAGKSALRDSHRFG